MMKSSAVILLAGLLAACTTTRAHVQPEESPALVVPPVPPRAIEPLPTTEPPVIPPVADLPGEPTIPQRPRTTPREPAKNSTEPKPDIKPETPPDPVTAQPPPTTPVPPRTGEAVEAARQIREVMDRATRLLDGIKREGLSRDRQANFDAARNFLNQAEEALKKNDLVLAKNLADRAEQIAKLLSGRNSGDETGSQPATTFEISQLTPDS